MPRAKQRTRALQDHILQVAVEMLASQGIAGFTTRKVAEGARTSTPAVYELFGDRAGLVRGVFFEGFRLLRRYFDALVETPDPRADLLALVRIYRRFLRDQPVLSHVMFSRPFADFDPKPSEQAAGASVRELIVARVQRCIDGGVFAGNAPGDATDIAHVVVALVHGLAAAELAERLGTSRQSVDRRWALGMTALIDGLAVAEPVARRGPRGRRRSS